ncbi:hypothetical protein NCPPB3778_40 [Rathayibacter phage NCPPB3778]|nr:hypothetical protein NCPPB3778_40 [Rathayibacter phage NCPPB3778]
MSSDVLVFVDAALAIDDRSVSDAWTRDVVVRVAEGAWTADEAVAAIRERFQG